MSANINTTRRRLDFGRKRNGPSLLANTASRSLSASFSEDVLTPQALKHATEFYKTATPPPEMKTHAEMQTEAQVAGVRNMVHAGPTQEDAAEHAALVRELLKTRVETQLASDEWMFTGVPVEREL